MAEVLEKLPSWAKRGRRTIYPYDQWFDGQVWLLTRGIDFVQERRGMATRIRSISKHRGLKITVSHRELPNGAEVVVVKNHNAAHAMIKRNG